MNTIALNERGYEFPIRGIAHLYGFSCSLQRHCLAVAAPFNCEATGNMDLEGDGSLIVC